MGLLDRVVPITETKPAKSRRAIYRTTDPYVTFWHREIGPLSRAGSIGLVDPQVLWDEAVAAKLGGHMGEVFERACRDFVRRQGQRDAEASPLPLSPLRVGEWWDAASNAEVDVGALGGRGELLVGECKWGAVTGRHLAKLRERADEVAQEVRDITGIHLALFSGRGDVDDQVREEAQAGRLVLFTAEAMIGR